jgi:hypothetical protein
LVCTYLKVSLFGVIILVPRIYPPIQFFMHAQSTMRLIFTSSEILFLKKKFTINFLSSRDQLADLLTKPLFAARFNFLCSNLNVHNLPFRLRGRVEDIIKFTEDNIDTEDKHDQGLLSWSGIIDTEDNRDLWLYLHKRLSLILKIIMINDYWYWR